MELEYTLLQGKADKMVLQLRSCLDDKQELVKTVLTIDEKTLSASVDKKDSGFKPSEHYSTFSEAKLHFDAPYSRRNVKVYSDESSLEIVIDDTTTFTEVILDEENCAGFSLPVDDMEVHLFKKASIPSTAPFNEKAKTI